MTMTPESPKAAQSLCSTVKSIARHARAAFRVAPRIGLRAVIEYVGLRICALIGWPHSGTWRIHLHRWPNPIYGRFGSSDIEVFRQVFIEEEHAWAHGVFQETADILVLDCGANIGLTSIYFSRLYPNAHILAVEPDARNFSMLAKNLSPMSPNITLLNAGLWARAGFLRCIDHQYRDGREWARQVQECSEAETGGVPATTIDSLLTATRRERIHILKVDIEGAEVVVFADEKAAWWDRVDTIAVELHDDTQFGCATETFLRAINHRSFSVCRSGELTVAMANPRNASLVGVLSESSAVVNPGR